jgi:hypothetical protein
MMEQSQQKSKQLRGEALKSRIVDAIHEYVSEQREVIDPKRISMKSIAAFVPCSRTTLLKYDDIVSNTLRDIGLRLARRTGEARSVALSDRVDFLRKQNEELKNELDALRIHHAKIYGQLYKNLEPMAALVKDEAGKILTRDGRCCLCGSVWPDEVQTNVVELSMSKRDPRKKQLKGAKDDGS